MPNLSQFSPDSARTEHNNGKEVVTATKERNGLSYTVTFVDGKMIGGKCNRLTNDKISNNKDLN